jgi:pimeloyl-ACP methyl ester carboxylesterase/DNA-binding winged helix-turn-helix (wHTH) protein
MAGETVHFGDYELDVSGLRLRHHGADIRIEPRAFDLLCYLVTHRDRVVPKVELLTSVWGDLFVSEAALTTALRTVRLAIGDSGASQQAIRTVHRRGYQFVAPVSTGQGHDGEMTPVSPGLDHQVIRYCTAKDGARIAFASIGAGAPLLKAANWMSHLDLERTTPVWSHWINGLAHRRQLVRYDERGSGLSDWTVPRCTFDDWVDDLETVVDAVGLDRFPLLGISQGGAVAIAYATRHPERVSRLILAGAYGRGRSIRARTDAEREAAAIDLELARIGWANQDPSFLQVFASQFLPDGTPQDWDDFTAFQRQTTSAANGIRFLEEFARINVSTLAPQVRCPTLILHSRDETRVPAAQASELAALIPNSRLILLDSRNHLLTAAEPAWPEFLSHIDAFLAED